jgi:hypothetical protein
MLSDEPGKPFDVPVLPVDAPLEPELIEPDGPVLLLVSGDVVGWLLELGFSVAAGVISSAITGAAANIVVTAAIAINFFI